ncbi:MAG: hypothetical protein ACKO04_09130, partial [Actinomycetes bacterium]
AETVRAVVTAARRRGLRPPVFRSPPRLDGVDRTIRRRPDGAVVIAVRTVGRPFASVQADVVEGVVVANGLGTSEADAFRRAAWTTIAASERPAELVVVAAPVPGVPDASPWDSPDPGPTSPPPDVDPARPGPTGPNPSGTMGGSSVRVA